MKGMGMITDGRSSASPAATVGDVIRLWHELAGPSTPNLKFEVDEWDGVENGTIGAVKI